MVSFVTIPKVNANDESADLISWAVGDKEYVHAGDTLCTIETTKSALDIVSECDGYINKIATCGLSYKVGYPIAYIGISTDDVVSDDAIRKKINALCSNDRINVPEQKKWTKKAEIKAKKLGVSIEQLFDVLGRCVCEDDIVSENDVRLDIKTIQKSLGSKSSFERVLILGGGGGASLVIDILSRSKDQKAVGILDNNPALIGNDVHGVPILGGFEIIDQLWNAGAFDTLISTIVRNPDERKLVFENMSQKGIPFANVIDSDVRVGIDTVLGKGNLIIYGSYLATGVKLGDNNFLAAYTSIEHHSHIGSHCTFGPRSSLAGAVMVEDRVKLGTQVAVEPEIKIGEGAIVASGIVLTASVEANYVVKNSMTLVTRLKG